MNKKCLVKNKGITRVLDETEKVYLNGNEVIYPVAVDLDLNMVRYVTQYPQVEVASGNIDIRVNDEMTKKKEPAIVGTTDTTNIINTIDTAKDINNDKHANGLMGAIKSALKGNSSQGTSRRGK